MKIIRKVFIGLLIVTFMIPQIPAISFAQVGSEEEEVSKHGPEIRFSVAEDIPAEKSGTGSSTWVWVILGALVVGGAIALAAGSGGGGGGNGGGTTSTNTSVNVGW